jgi:hypothetical protein
MFNNGAPQTPWGLQSLMPQQPMQQGLLAPPQQMPQQKGLLDQMGGLGGLLSMASMMKKAPPQQMPPGYRPLQWPGAQPQIPRADDGMGGQVPTATATANLSNMAGAMPNFTQSDPGMFASLMRMFGGQ